MIQIEPGLVLSIIGERPGILELKVMVANQEERAIQYTDLSAPVVPGQSVLLNTTAVRLGLGTGGYHFVMPNSIQRKDSPEAGKLARLETGHIMKLRYTPQQIRVTSCEEPVHPLYETICEQDSLAGMCVIAAELHSMLPAIAASIHYQSEQARKVIAQFQSQQQKPPRIVYVMTDGAALPIALSKTVFELKEKGLLAGTVTVGHAFGGDLEAVNLYSGLLAAKYGLAADIAIVTMGPGIVGTGTRFGHTGIEQGQAVNATVSLAGTSVVCPRLSFADPRDRHYGLSHHTLTVLDRIALAESILPIPLLESPQMGKVLQQLQTNGIADKHRVCFEDGSVITQAADYFDIRLMTMGRSLSEELPFFMAAAASGVTALRLWSQAVTSLPAGDVQKDRPAT